MSIALVYFNDDDHIDLFLFLRTPFDILFYPGSKEEILEGREIFNDLNYIWVNYIAVSNFNNDNYIDLSYVDSQKGDLVIRIGNGTASFGDPVSYSIGNLACPTAFAIGHLNNDNYTDIAVINYHAELLSIFFGLGNGKFGPEKHLETKRLTFSRSIVLADINNDSIDDIIVSNSDNNTISVFINRGDGKFHDEKVSYLLTEYSAEHIALGDLNDDKEVDIVISYEFGNRLTISFGNGSGYFNVMNHLYLQVSSDILTIKLCDLNSDNHLEILIVQPKPYTFTILYGYGDEDFHHKKIFSLDSDVSMAWIDVADINKDSCKDIVLVDRETQTPRIFMNKCLCSHNKTIETNTLTLH
ncbi:unnamed protein product [Adineta steineri]|uniref:VCBS repeat-containing protein n=1 Tax=Adineta steineri TaxID=433720 RepID=A0A820A8Z4_9BILA|nr:unnamed protein product [Adineta steineri]CAF4189245.1 unnamed protein product [Adineta steineri]